MSGGACRSWLGRCHYRSAEGEVKALAAVWTDTREDIERTLNKALATQGAALIWAEDASPALDWLARHGHDPDAIALARAVHGGHPVAFGTGDAIAREAPASDYLIVEEIEGVEPLGDQFGIADKKTVPDALREPLFGQPDPTDDEINRHGGLDAVPPLKTYAILDAAKIGALPERIAMFNLGRRCLFQGKALDDLGDVAPWVVELHDDNDFVRSLFTKADDPKALNAHWDAEAGMFLRSRSDIDAIWSHVRKFTRVQDTHGRFFYLRYWDPGFFLDYVQSLKEEKLRMFMSHMFCTIHRSGTSFFRASAARRSAKGRMVSCG